MHFHPLADVPQVPPDVMFGPSAAYRADNDPRKVDLGVGAYRHEDGKAWVLPAAREARSVLLQDGDLADEYLPIEGLALYLEMSQRLVFGAGATATMERRVASVQTLSGTGALHLGALFLSRFLPVSESKKVYVSDPPYVNHVPILRHADLEVACAKNFGQSRILLHVYAHNPTGTDLSAEQWKDVAQIMKSKQHIPFFDSAYTGFASGDPESDAWPVRYFVEQRFDVILVAQSYAKNFGLYGERAGCLHVVTSSPTIAGNISSQLRALQRVTILTPPAFGARIVSTVLADEKLEAIWREDLKTMAGRIASMRQALRECLEKFGVPGQWDHLNSQIGMFCYSGLTAEQVDVLRDIHHVFMTKDGRMSVAGLNAINVDYVAGAIKSVVEQGSHVDLSAEIVP